MDQLEGTTIDLIYRRRMHTFYPAYAIVVIVVGTMVALPLVKVDVVATAGGMIRPCNEPSSIISPITGIVDSSRLADHMAVDAGDTLIWFRRDLPETSIETSRELVRINRGYISDIRAILRGHTPSVTSRFKQSYINHLAAEHQLGLQQELLRKKFIASEKLVSQGVIPPSEFEQARSDYLVSCARMDDNRESYRSLLEDELYRLESENRLHLGEIEKIKSSLQNYYVIAPAGGTLRQCPGITGGSLIQLGASLGTISPQGHTVAECYVETRDIAAIQTGMPVRIRLDGPDMGRQCILESSVAQIDTDVMVTGGRPVYRVRCNLAEEHFRNDNGLYRPVILGMTFSASMVLCRKSLASLLLERMKQRMDPALAHHKPPPIHGKDS
jgi:multidrug resistance efflux pump